MGNSFSHNNIKSTNQRLKHMLQQLALTKYIPFIAF